MTGRVNSKSLDAVSSEEKKNTSESIAINAKNGKTYTNIPPSLFIQNKNKDMLYDAFKLKQINENPLINLVLIYNNRFCVEEMTEQKIQNQNYNDCR